MMFDSENIDIFLLSLEKSGAEIIRSYHSRDWLVKLMQSAIDEGNSCVFVPSLKSLRSFFNTDGFISTMEEVESCLKNYKVLIKAGKYNTRHIFAIEPMDRGCTSD